MKTGSYPSSADRSREDSHWETSQCRPGCPSHSAEYSRTNSRRWLTRAALRPVTLLRELPAPASETRMSRPLPMLTKHVTGGAETRQPHCVFLVKARAVRDRVPAMRNSRAGVTPHLRMPSETISKTFRQRPVRTLSLMPPLPRRLSSMPSGNPDLRGSRTIGNPSRSTAQWNAARAPKAHTFGCPIQVMHPAAALRKIGSSTDRQDVSR